MEPAAAGGPAGGGADAAGPAGDETARYVLSSGGQIAGIVNPPGPKAWYEVGEHNPENAAQWREAAQRRTGSWWEDWAAWADSRAGRLGPPRTMGSQHHPALGDAAGDYIRG